jgi:hypothetical protein
LGLVGTFLGLVGTFLGLVGTFLRLVGTFLGLVGTFLGLLFTVLVVMVGKAVFFDIIRPFYSSRLIIITIKGDAVSLKFKTKI